MRIGRHTIEVSHREKIFFPRVGLTKGDVIDYYERVAETMLSHMEHYGVSMHRFPDGLEGESFFHKNAPDYFPDWVPRVEIPERQGGSYRAPVVNSKAALVYLADQAVLTPHLYLSRITDLEHPDRMIYDFDPPEGSNDYGAVRQAALDMRGVLHEVRLVAWVQATGSKGFHVIIPLRRDQPFNAVRQFAHDTALLLMRRHPDTYTLEQRKDKRKGRMFLDTLRNTYGATAVAPYALRALPEAPVATPLEWDEVERGTSPRDWTLRDIPRRLGQRQDPWLGLMRHARSLSGRRERLDRLLDEAEPAEEER